MLPMGLGYIIPYFGGSCRALSPKIFASQNILGVPLCASPAANYEIEKVQDSVHAI